MASKYAEYDARANEADKRISELAARVAAMEKAAAPASGGGDAATIKALEAKIAKLEKENANLKQALQGAGTKKEKPAKKEQPQQQSKKDKKKDKGGDKKGGDKKADDDKALFKAALKEGGKKGQDICGLNEMGGVVFFHIAVESANGRWDLMEEVMKGFNTPVDPAAEDRKGGAGHLCKALLSAGDTQLLIYVHVPKNHAQLTSAPEWGKSLMEGMGPQAKVVEENAEFIKIAAPADPDNNLFPLKMRDQSIGQGFGFLRKKNLVLEDDSDDDVDYGEMAAGADISWGGAGTDY